MKNLQIYLNFPGNCREVINFYYDAIGGEIKSIQTFEEAHMEVPDEFKSNIIHCVYDCAGVTIMASDNMPGQSPIMGTNFALTIDCSNEEEQDRIFNNLCDGGEITMPLQVTFWKARFGMVKDKFGINWMLNLNQEG